jgi:outer membrane protein OmpA-like peptidoglycan-associated protein
MKIKIVLFLIFLFTFHSHAVDNYLHVNVGGGYHTLSYPLLNGTQSGGLGGTANVGFSHFFTEEWGVQTCLGVQSFSAKSKLNYISSVPDVDSQGEAYFFKANFKNSIEQQQALFLDIPLALQFRHIFTEEIGLMATLGAKVSVPLAAGYKTTGTIVTSGFYPQYGDKAELTDMPVHDFLSDTHSYSNNVAFKTAYAAVMDFGALYRLSDETDLYAGAYFNYGLNNILTPDNKLIYQRIGIYNGVLSSSQTDAVKPISFGLKVGLYFHLPEYIPAGKTDLVAPKTKVSEIKIPVKLPTTQTQASKTIQRGKVVEAKDILEARRIVLANKQLKEKTLISDSLRKADSLLIAKRLVASKTVTGNKETKPTVAPKYSASVSMPQLDEIIQVGGKKSKSYKAPKTVKQVKVQQSDTIVPRKVVRPVAPVIVAKVDTVIPKPVEVKPVEIEKPVRDVQPSATPVIPQKEAKREAVALPSPTLDQEEDPFVVAKRIAASFDIKFKFSSDEMVEPDLDKLKALSEILKAYPYIRLHLAGHTDNVGSLRANFKLGDKRASVVKQLFVDDGVLDKNVITKSKAYLEPVVPNSTEENKALNRRVDMTVEKFGKPTKFKVQPSQVPKEQVKDIKSVASNAELLGKERILFGKNLAQLALKYYGSRDFWVYIYEANKDHIANPNKISFGTLIYIPKLDPSLIELNNPSCIEKAKALQQALSY